MKDEVGWKIIKRIVGLRAKTYSYIINDGGKDKKPKGTRICIQKATEFEDYQKCLEATKLKNKLNHPEKNEIDKDSLKKSSRIHKKE